MMRVSHRKKKTQSPVVDPALSEDLLITDDLEENLDLLKSEFSYPTNSDFLIKPIFIRALNKKGYLCYINGTYDNQALEEHVIKPLVSREVSEETEWNTTLLTDHILTSTKNEQTQVLKKLVKGLLTGHVVLLIEEWPEAVAILVAKFEARAVEKPENELVIKGPKESFVESGETNRSLVRKLIKNQFLITEEIEVGAGGENRYYVMYLKNITNKDLIKRVKKRMNEIKSEEIIHLPELEQHIEERPYSLIPSCLLTERPDRAVSYLKEGHVIVLNEVSPYALITPVTFFTLFQTSEDYYERWAFGNFIRLIRIVAIFVALLTPSVYIAATNYSPEMLQTDLLLAIASTREIVPFPTIVEVLIMELLFELLREAGIRIPTAIGPTIGIVGALILGQAAVEANIVSPIIVIVVALTGLASFAIPEVNLSYVIRILRFVFLGAASIIGFFGISLVIVLCLAYMASVRTFGVGFLSPLTPHKKSSGDLIFRPPLMQLWLRPQHMNPIKDKRSPKPKPKRSKTTHERS